MDEQHEEKVPRPINRPRGGQRQPIPGRKPGVGFPMPAWSYAGLDHGHAPYKMVDSDDYPTRYGPHWLAGAPGFHGGSELKDNLETAFANRTAWWPVNYDEWSGVAEPREIDDLKYSQAGDGGYKAWLAAKLWNQGRPVAAPPAASMISGVEGLTNGQRMVVQMVVDALRTAQPGIVTEAGVPMPTFMAGEQESSAAPGGTSWGVLLAQVAPIIGRFLEGEKPTAMDLLALLPVLLAIQEKRKAEKGGDA